MAAKYLGDYFDIHCGGEDHIPIHHTNEIAQTEASRGTRLANFWMHGYFLQLENAKMSKSTGEFLRLESLAEHGLPMVAYRYFCLTAHYRTQMSFSWESLEANNVALQRLYLAAWEWGAATDVDPVFYQRFLDHVNDDLNMPRALAVAWELVKSGLDNGIKKATILAFDVVFGLGIAGWEPAEVSIPAAVQQLADDREAARQAKQWQLADELRASITAAGFVVEDTREGPRLKSL
jgi:cysteinyl-tRNA synthetase